AAGRGGRVRGSSDQCRAKGACAPNVPTRLRRSRQPPRVRRLPRINLTAMAPPQRTGASGAVRERRAPAGSWDTADTYLSVAQARRRAVSLLVLSVLVPGSAQIVAGNRAIGRIVLRIWFGILLIAALLGGIAFLSISTVVGILSASWFLRLAQWALYAWAAIWALVLIDAWRLGRPDSQ